jgi:hypothetical protein
MTSQRLSLIWPLLIIAVAALWMAQSLGVLPGPVIDLISRAWPILLVVVGLMLLLGRRVRFGNLASLILSTAIVGGVVFVAYRQQSTRVATDNHKTFTQAIDPQINTVNIVLTTLNTEIAISPELNTTGMINADFTGSRASVLTSDFKVDGPAGTFTLNETQNSNLAPLEGLGRGKLTLSLPATPSIQQVTLNITGHGGDIHIDPGSIAFTDVTVSTDAGAATVGTLPKSLITLSISGSGDLDLGTLPDGLSTLTLKTTNGKVSFDATAASLKNMTVSAGTSMTASLPNKSGLIGDIKAGTDVTITIPATIAANIRLIGNAANTPAFNQSDYILNIDKVLVSRRSNEPQMQLKIDAGGKVTIQ